jgi:hypothetical protein
MHQKDLVKHAWEQAGLYKRNDARLREFLRLVDASPTACWTELAELARTRFPELVETLAMPLWNTKDKLLRVNLLRIARLDDPTERRLLDAAIRQTNAATDGVELRAVLQRADVPLAQLVANKKHLAPEMKVYADRRIADLAPHPAPPAVAPRAKRAGPGHRR